MPSMRTIIDGNHLLVKRYDCLEGHRWHVIPLHRSNGEYRGDRDWTLSTLSGIRLIWRGWFIIIQVKGDR